MARVAIYPRPGVMRAATPNASAGRWYDQNLMRWRGGQLQPIGGNMPLGGYKLADAGRDLLTWHDNKGERWSALGTDTALYAYRFATQMLYPILTGLPPLGHPGARLGYGLADYSESDYGTARESADIGPSDQSPLLGDQWSMDLFGEDLMIVPTQDGRLFRWSPSAPGTVGAVVPNAPIDNAAVFVTDERHVVLLGAGGRSRAVAWSDQEKPDVWATLVDNMAGTKDIETEGRPLLGVRVVGGNLILTDNDAHLMRYVGPPYAYGINKIGANCGPISRRAISQSAFSTAWMGMQTFWQYDGSVKPLECPVGDWLFSIINRDMIGRVFGSPNPTFGEHWWFWPGEGATECNRYAAINYADGGHPWIIGQMARSAADVKGAMLRPILADVTGQVFLHEFGWTDAGASRVGLIYTETGDFAPDDATDRRFHVTQIVQDFVGPDERVGYRFWTWEEPDGDELEEGVFPITNNSGLTDARFSCRGCRMRIEALTDGPFAIGRTRLAIRWGGAR